MSLVEFAREELQRAGMYDKDGDYGGMMGDAVLKMIEVFADEDHSGFSAGIAVSLFEKLARYEPITPLTGDASEWNEIGEQNGKPRYQNRRCSHVFKEGDDAYDIEGRIFRDPDGCCYTNYNSRVPVTFPYVPKREYVDRP